MPGGTSIEETEMAIHEDTHLQRLKSYIIYGWPHKKDELEPSIRHSVSYAWNISIHNHVRK